MILTFLAAIFCAVLLVLCCALTGFTSAYTLLRRKALYLAPLMGLGLYLPVLYLAFHITASAWLMRAVFLGMLVISALPVWRRKDEFTFPKLSLLTKKQLVLAGVLCAVPALLAAFAQIPLLSGDTLSGGLFFTAPTQSALAASILASGLPTANPTGISPEFLPDPGMLYYLLPAFISAVTGIPVAVTVPAAAAACVFMLLSALIGIGLNITPKFSPWFLLIALLSGGPLICLALQSYVPPDSFTTAVVSSNDSALSLRDLKLISWLFAADSGYAAALASPLAALLGSLPSLLAAVLFVTALSIFERSRHLYQPLENPALYLTALYLAVALGLAPDAVATPAVVTLAAIAFSDFCKTTARPDSSILTRLYLPLVIFTGICCSPLLMDLLSMGNGSHFLEFAPPVWSGSIDDSLLFLGFFLVLLTTAYPHLIVGTLTFKTPRNSRRHPVLLFLLIGSLFSASIIRLRCFDFAPSSASLLPFLVVAALFTAAIMSQAYRPVLKSTLIFLTGLGCSVALVLSLQSFTLRTPAVQPLPGKVAAAVHKTISPTERYAAAPEYWPLTLDSERLSCIDPKAAVSASYNSAAQSLSLILSGEVNLNHISDLRRSGCSYIIALPQDKLFSHPAAKPLEGLKEAYSSDKIRIFSIP
ncbi:MAG: hypothetical protein IJ228_08710 [Succinivibrio sp.]|nr:hypothetical protein [Succinivibrio sp.]